MSPGMPKPLTCQDKNTYKGRPIRIIFTHNASVLPVVRRPGGWRVAEAEGGRLRDSWLDEGEQAACDVPWRGRRVRQRAGAGSLGTPLDAHHVFDYLGDGVRVTDHGDQLVAARLGLQLTGARAGVLLSSAEQIHADN